MNAFHFLLDWYNLPFLAALSCGLLLALLQIFSGFGDSDSDTDIGADTDTDVDVDIDADADADIDVDAGGVGETLGGVLAGIGVGRIPVTMILMVFLGTLGAVGLLGNTLLAGMLNGYPNIALLPMLLGGVVLALFLTGQISGLLARVTQRSSVAIGFEQLVGRTGIVVSPNVSRTYGRVAVRDSYGSLHTVYAVITEGEPLPDQTEVVLLTYDAVQRRFIVKPFY